ncbi:AraC family transcriptional regulator [Rhizobium sp. CSW-27]|uniref:helix-turn-helix transcriptional regulator n=1 Tax=Rhizobium sp. CSW-27 TaxID=2839985 RepID=UPI001C038D79|nr:AraC family transcriptional regulator [Rhizobium sp. CSW-27]MBT9372933.1 AraC family transcriptional regulator [Rhizobium sp. CSW-27]
MSGIDTSMEETAVAVAMQAPISWKACVDAEIDQLGWREATRTEQPGDDITIYTIDVTPPEDLVFRPEGPATFSLSVFLDGAGTLSVDGGKPLRVQPGTAVFFACDRVTRGENHVDADRRLSIVDIRVEKPLLEKLGGISLARLGGAVITENSLPDQDVFLIGFKAPAELLNVAADVLQCRFSSGLARRAYLYGKAIQAVSIGLDAVTRQSDSVPLKPLTKEELARLHTALSLIEQHYSADWTIARLAREVGLNERRLKEGFRLAIGVSVHAHLRATRLDVAATLLSAGASVTEAAYAVGFDNLSHFSKAFREAKGVLPSRYRS